MNWYKIAQQLKYLYHGTSEGAFRDIRINGLSPKNGFIWLTDKFSYAMTYAEKKGSRLPFGPRVLRVVKTEDMIPDNNITIPGDFITKRNIPPQEIEVLVENKWIFIQQYIDTENNIMPIK